MFTKATEITRSSLQKVNVRLVSFRYFTCNGCTWRWRSWSNWSLG